MSQTVNYGIDLGTTSSLIAKFTPKGAIVIPSANRSVVTPSVVALNSQEQVLVGQAALRDPEWRPASAFKRHMGTSVKLPLGPAHQAWSPERLSAEVLKELRAAARRRFNDDVVDVVITVPAMFQQPQCEATRQAAGLAGLRAVALIQEPIAAAGAYLSGRSEPKEGHYLVYDLGGGTFDVSVLRLRDGELKVRAHGGDNYLGGHDIDRLLKEWALQELLERGRLESGLSPLQDWLLTQEVEQAKIRLTDEEETTLELTALGLGLSKLDITREKLDGLVAPLVEKTLRFCQERLARLDLTAGDVEEVFLVGGPTQMPYLRRRLREEFDCHFSFEIDPITAVVEGAALHAGGILETREALPPVTSRSLALELHFDPLCNELETSVAGRLAASSDFDGEILLKSSADDWATGWLPLVNGAFFTELSLKPGVLNLFDLQIRDQSGNAYQPEPAQVAIKQGLASAAPIAPYNYGVVLSSGRSAWMLRENTPLPAYKSQTYRAAVDLGPDSTSTLNIYLIEGHSTFADDNVKVGELVLSGTDLPYSLSAGDDVEIRLRMDQSRYLKAWVYFPVHDREFEIGFNSSIDRVEPTELQRASETLTALLEKAQVGNSDDSLLCLSESARELSEEITSYVANPAEPGEAERLNKKLSDLRAEVRPFSTQTDLDELLDETLKNLEMAAVASEAFDDDQTATNCRRMKDEAVSLHTQGNIEALRDLGERASDIFQEHYRKTPAFWHGFLEFLQSNLERSSDPRRLQELVLNAEQSLQEGHISAAKTACVEGFQLLPKEARSHSGPFAAPGLAT